MNLDVLASIEMTACAAVAIGVFATGFGEDLSTRLRIAAGLGGWFILVTLMAATEVLHDEHGFGVAGLGVVMILPIAMLWAAVLRSPTLHEALRAIPLPVLIGVNAIRAFGVTFLLLYTAGRLPAPFAPVAGWGDIVVGLTAAPIAWLSNKNEAASHSAVWTWNMFGLLDLIAAVGLGVTSSPGPLRLIFAEPGSGIMTTLPWVLIPGFLVPLLASTHLAVFYRLVSAGANEHRARLTHERSATV